MTKTLIALDVDGVVNHFSKSAMRKSPAGNASGKIDEWVIQWRIPLLERLRAVLRREDVTGAWLTTWLQAPELLDQLEEILGLTGLVPLRAEYPHKLTLPWGGESESFNNPRFEGTLSYSRDHRWWKYVSASMLMEDFKPERFAWLDDEIGKNTSRTDPWFVRETPELLLLKTHPIAGLLPEDLERLEAWVSLNSIEPTSPAVNPMT